MRIVIHGICENAKGEKSVRYTVVQAERSQTGSVPLGGSIAIDVSTRTTLNAKAIRPTETGGEDGSR